MQRFHCPSCNNELHFDNAVCMSCGNDVGYQADCDKMLVAHSGSWSSTTEDDIFSACSNRGLIGCNWLVAGKISTPCLSCRHTLIIPDLSQPENRERWQKLESAKRLLFYSLIKFNLPLEEKGDVNNLRLRFELKADVLTVDGNRIPTMTGYDSGRITINIEESDDGKRELLRVAMGEPYRTLIGHFRHEIGHYYWDLLVSDKGDITQFRAIFGDERENYGDALQRHYEKGPSTQWEMKFVSAYASSHPWEDFAETWAHYFHMVDGLETGESYNLGELKLTSARATIGPYGEVGYHNLLSSWIPLTVSMNAMNRSIGNHDFYPFILSDEISRKLEFVHSLIHNQPNTSASPDPKFTPHAND